MKEMGSNTSLEPLLMEGDRECDNSSPDFNEKNNPRSPFFTRKSLSVFIANFLLLILSVVILVFAKFESSRQSSLCTKEHSFYSPALEGVKYEKVRFAGLPELDSKWRGPPSSLLDEAWDNVTSKVPEIPVDESVVHRTHNQLDINSLTRFPPEFGGQIYSEVEWKHQLHCLNLMRKYIHFDYYKNTTSLFYAYSSDEIVNHLAHCIDMLRQSVMCNADTGLIFSYWIEGHDHKHVDFNNEHVCRNFESLLEYQQQNGHLIAQKLLVRHPGAVDLPDYPENVTRLMMRPEERNKYYL